VSSYMNHSCDPTVEIIDYDLWVTRRDVKKGEELTYDYAMSEVAFSRLPVCLCGSGLCRGKVTKNDYQLSEVRKFVLFVLVPEFDICPFSCAVDTCSASPATFWPESQRNRPFLESNEPTFNFFFFEIFFSSLEELVVAGFVLGGRRTVLGRDGGV
jgi:hypothetical protein